MHASLNARRSPSPRSRTHSLSRERTKGSSHRSRLREAVEGRRIVDQDESTGGIVRKPRSQEIEEDGVVGLVRQILFGRMRPVAAPYHAVGRRLAKGLRELRRIGIPRRSEFGVPLGARELVPPPPFLQGRG